MRTATATTAVRRKTRPARRTGAAAPRAATDSVAFSNSSDQRSWRNEPASPRNRPAQKNHGLAGIFRGSAAGSGAVRWPGAVMLETVGVVSDTDGAGGPAEPIRPYGPPPAEGRTRGSVAKIRESTIPMLDGPEVGTSPGYS